MATWTYEDVVPSLIENTSMRKAFMNGVHKTYRIQAVDGYVLHDTSLDYVDMDPNTYEPIGTIMGYSMSEGSVAASYDFTVTEIIDGYTAYGSRKIFARPRSEVPENQIFGGADNNHEIM